MQTHAENLQWSLVVRLLARFFQSAPRDQTDNYSGKRNSFLVSCIPSMQRKRSRIFGFPPIL